MHKKYSSQALVRGRGKESLVHMDCSHMCQVSLVTCILLRYTMEIFVYLLKGHTVELFFLLDIFGMFWSQKQYRSDSKMIVKLQRERLCQSHAIGFCYGTDAWIIPVSEELIAFITPSSSSTQSVVSGRHLSCVKSRHLNLASLPGRHLFLHCLYSCHYLL